MTPALLLLAAVAAGSAAGTAAMRRFSHRRALLDHPNDRSSHVLPTPRLGGVAIAIAAFGGWVAAAALGLAPPGGAWNAILAGSLVMLLVGVADDVRSLGPAAKAAGQLLAGLITAAIVAPSPAIHGWLGGSIAILWLVAYTNQFNFMDGSDGLAAGMAVINGLGIAALAGIAQRPELTWLALVMAAAAAGFLRSNFPPASIFMGDAGSHFLGFASAFLVLALVDAGVSPLAAGGLLAPFLVDTVFTLARRAAGGEKIWRAHRSHFYQRLLIKGWSPKRVALLYYSWGAWATLLSAWLAAVGRPNAIEAAVAAAGHGLAAAAVITAARSLPRLDHQVQAEAIAERADQPSGIQAPREGGGA